MPQYAEAKRDASPRAAQRQRSPAQRFPATPTPLSERLNGSPSSAVMQAMAAILARAPAVQRMEGAGTALAARTPNRTGLPDGLKAGVEALSGISMDDVRVHRNSSRPAALQAHAYAQGSDIHLAPGQERHLPHEAWHVVQQKQGRVAATRQLMARTPINDDVGLEHEADVMGGRAISLAPDRSDSFRSLRASYAPAFAAPAQRTTIVIGYQEGDTMYNASLNGLTAPRPVYYFTNSGEHLPAGPSSTIGLTLAPGTDTTKIHVIGHGSPGKLASLDLPVFLRNLDELASSGAIASVHTRDVTEVRLGVCYAMMREDGASESVALQIARWLQSKADSAIDQQVKLVAGYTANSGGEFAAERPSLEPLDTQSTIDVQYFQLYLFYAAKAKLTEAGLYKHREVRDALKDEYESAASEIPDQIVKIAPVPPWEDRSRTMPEEHMVSATGVVGSSPLHPGYTVASVTTANFHDFPRRLILFESLETVAGEVREILASAVDALVAKCRKAVPAVVEAPTGWGAGFAVSGATFGGGVASPATSGQPIGFGFGFGAPTGSVTGFGSTSGAQQVPGGFTFGSGSSTFTFGTQPPAESESKKSDDD